MKLEVLESTGFIPVEMNVLEYEESRESNIAPHFDDFWVWGEYIVGLNLVEETVMTFSKTIKE
jgi:alkylated DNA repair protein alkB family protein 4